jgi:hypothetical protein
VPDHPRYPRRGLATAGCHARLLIITRDRNIQDHRAEIGAVRDHSARMVTLHGPEARGTWEQLEIFMSRWRDIERCLDEAGPFSYTVTRTTFRPIELA